MKTKKLNNILEGFNFELLDNPEFKEDSVREEIINPILKGLGYCADIPNQIIRSRRLLHPFVSIGTKKKEIFIIPDYLFEVNGKPAWILDAKSPTENLTKTQHVEQAYSYAIHSEVRVGYFALCNGKEFVLYDIQKIEPILQFPIVQLPMFWDNLKRLLSPENVFANNHLRLAKDLGLHLKRLGFDKCDSLIFPLVPIQGLGQVSPGMCSFSSGIKDSDDSYAVTFDFGNELLCQLDGKIPQKAIDILKNRVREERQIIQFGDTVFYVTVDCRIGDELQENEDEIFLPLVINRFLE